MQFIDVFLQSSFFFLFLFLLCIFILSRCRSCFRFRFLFSCVFLRLASGFLSRLKEQISYCNLQTRQCFSASLPDRIVHCAHKIIGSLLSLNWHFSVLFINVWATLKLLYSNITITCIQFIVKYLLLFLWYFLLFALKKKRLVLSI